MKTYVSSSRMVDDRDEVIDDELDDDREDPLTDCTSLMGPFPVEIIQVMSPVQTLINEIVIKVHISFTSLKLTMRWRKSQRRNRRH